VHEVAAPDGERLDDVVAEVRRAVAEVHDIPVDAVTLIRRSTLPKTTSGKIQRSACRASHMEGSLDVVHRWERGLTRDASTRSSAARALDS
jgi:acyl-coenzyme A synthetase/AMP-(fatty) acid ligase